MIGFKFNLFACRFFLLSFFFRKRESRKSYLFAYKTLLFARKIEIFTLGEEMTIGNLAGNHQGVDDDDHDDDITLSDSFLSVSPGS